MIGPALVFAGVAAVAAWQLLTLSDRVLTVGDGAPTSLEAARRQSLRQRSLVYFLLPGPVRALATWLAKRAPERLATIQRSLARSGAPLAWQPAEWLAVRLLEAGLCGAAFVGALAAIGASRPAQVWAGLLAGGCYALAAQRLLQARGQRRLQQLRQRLPFLLDTVALTMEAGAGFRDALTLAARTCGTHPLAAEIERVLSEAQRGRLMGEALQAWGLRLGDPMVNEFALNSSYSIDKGNAVSKLFLEMAQRMRERRAQEIETAAGRAEVQLTYPALLLVLVCMAVVVAPFVAPMRDILKSFAS